MTVIGFVNRQDFLDDLHFHDDRVVDEEVDTVSELNEDVVVQGGKRPFDINLKPLTSQLVRQTVSVRALEQPGSEP